ncbi:hypothetical protein LCGC14_2514770, partial [marine sediment metagenome]
GLDCGHPGDTRRIVGKPYQKGDSVACPACRDIDSAYQAGVNDERNKAHTEITTLKSSLLISKDLVEAMKGVK